MTLPIKNSTEILRLLAQGEREIANGKGNDLGEVMRAADAFLVAAGSNATGEGEMREPAFVRMIRRGLADSRTGRTISSQEMARRIKSWGK